MKNLIILCLFVIGSINVSSAQIASLSKKMKQETVSETFSWDKKVHNFGQITQNKAVSTTFIIRNNGEEPLILKSVKGSCGCTIADYKKTPIKPNETTEIKVTYNAKAKGNFTKGVTVITSASSQPQMLKIKGEVVVSLN